MANVYDIIIRPIITERSMVDVANKKYVFEVAKDAGKVEIKNAVETAFGVKVAKVNTLNVSGKAKRLGAGRLGKTRSWKKAYVQLAEDSKTIELFEGMVYVFEVAKDAGKVEIKNAVETAFGVKVAKVNTLNVSGKAKRLGAGRLGKTRSWKKAYVQLAEDSKTIELFEGMV